MGGVMPYNRAQEALLIFLHNVVSSRCPNLFKNDILPLIELSNEN